jgi:hypothetical protein
VNPQRPARGGDPAGPQTNRQGKAAYETIIGYRNEKPVTLPKTIIEMTLEKLAGKSSRSAGCATLKPQVAPPTQSPIAHGGVSAGEPVGTVAIRASATLATGRPQGGLARHFDRSDPDRLGL